MLEWLKKVLVGPEMTSEERQIAAKCCEAAFGRKLFRLDGPTAEQFIKEFGFPVRGDSNGKQFFN